MSHGGTVDFCKGTLIFFPLSSASLIYYVLFEQLQLNVAAEIISSLNCSPKEKQFLS